MQIDKELLSEKNYKGARQIIITDATVMKLKNEIDKYQKQANPILNKMEKIAKEYEEELKEIGELTSKINEIKAKIKPAQERYNTELIKVQELDNKANLIKNKIYPLIAKHIEGKLGEFEEAREITTEKGVLKINIYDKIEEFVKVLRTKNSVKNIIK